ncbi:MAG: hypothetical protein VKJ46_01555, partial [Leptolyngbyaceae bacterium]|nr:hypothetical protein [Leptolyngbyaceae bacterium]
MTFSANSQIPSQLPLDLVSGIQHSEKTGCRMPPLPAEHYQNLLTQIAWSIRRTLDLDTIWQQTVHGLGTALNVNHCIICSYQANHSTVKVVAEYRQESGLASKLGQELNISDQEHLSQALTLLEPVIVESPLIELPKSVDLLREAPQLPAADSFSLYRTAQVIKSHQQSLLVVATCYQDQPNGLICLYPTAQAEA